jgi:hypothetical protein
MDFKLASLVSTLVAPYKDIDDELHPELRALISSEFKGQVAEIRKGFARQNVDAKLVEIALAPFEHFMNKPNFVQTRRRLIYLHDVIEELIPIANGSKQMDDGPHLELLNILIYENFNSIKFLDYYKKMVRTDLDEQENQHDQLSRINWWLKTIIQADVRPNVELWTTRGTTKGELRAWIEAEQLYLDGECKRNPMNNGQDKEESARIPVAVPISVLACMLKLWLDTGFIKKLPGANIIKIFSRVFGDKNDVPASEETFRSRMSNPSAATVDAVREWLHKMIKALSQ